MPFVLNASCLPRKRRGFRLLTEGNAPNRLESGCSTVYCMFPKPPQQAKTGADHGEGVSSAHRFDAFILLQRTSSGLSPTLLWKFLKKPPFSPPPPPSSLEGSRNPNLVDRRFSSCRPGGGGIAHRDSQDSCLRECASRLTLCC